MSLQTNVFENGRWVTRSIDPYQMRARNMDKEKNAMSRPNPAKAPSLGLLTKTLVRSSVTKWILPVRVRHQSKNDVLFIAADRVDIKEALGNSTLKNIGVKADFDSPIKSARIIGDLRELTRDNKLSQFWTDQEDIAVNAHSTSKRTLPPHIAVLGLESHKLVFLCATNGTSEEPEWLSWHKELPGAASPLEKLGEHIAVDPKSRVIAVAAHEGGVYLYALQSMEQMRKDFEEKSLFEPIKEERLLPDFPTKGVILKMEFLYPSQNDHGQIILLLIISKHRKSRMLWYEWNSGTTLRESQLKAEVRALPEDEQLPLLLIPLKLHSATFMIICEKRITLYRDILTGSPSRYVQHLEDVKDPEEPGSSGRQPIWVQWARPMRTPKHQRHIKFDDAIFLCREDGIVQYLELYNNLDHMLDSTHPAGRLGISMNTAFAILDLGPATVDLLAAGGDMSEGGLWRFGPRVDPTRVTTIPTWSPLSDFVAATIADKAPISVRSNATTEEVVGAPSRIFACTGRGKHGAISELRCGIEASRKPGYVDLGEEVKNSVLGIWAFHGYYGEARQQNDWSEPSKKDATYILMSHPTRTSLLRIQWVKDPGLGNRDLGLDYTARTELVTKDLGIDYNARTITSAATPYGMTIQVTENSIRTTTLLIPKAIKSEEMDDDEPEEIKPATGLQGRYIYRYESYRVLAACIHTFLDGNKDETLPNETYILLALQIDEAYHVQFGQLLEQFWPTATLTLSSQPSCLLLHRVCAYLLAFVATLDGRLHVFVADERREKLHMVCDFEFEGPFAICDSLTIITSNGKDETQSNYLVVCGLRDGLVVVLRLVGVPEWELFFYEELRIGYTSVTVLSDSTARFRAIMHCENLLCALEYPKEMEAPATVSKIWITDDNQPLLQIGPVSAVTQAVSSWISGNVPGFLAGSFFCIDGALLHTVTLEPRSQPQMVPRRLKLGGGPVRIIHSAHLNKLIVLYNKTSVLRQRVRDVPGKRAMCPSIVFLNPDRTPGIKPNPDAEDMENDRLLHAERKHGEKFLGITEWFPKVGGNECHMLVVNTILSRGDKPVGRLLFFAITIGDTDFPKLTLKQKIELEAPVYAVAAYPEKSLVYCCGSVLCMQTLAVADLPGYKWQLPIVAATRSAGRCLTVREPLIYASSTGESLAVYKYEVDKLVYQYGDQSARDGLHHVHVPEHSLVLASDMNKAVVGLWQPPERRIDNVMPSVFEAKLLGSITRLRRVTRPIWHGYTERETMEDALIGSSTDGTITQFAILKQGWRLLRFIQNMAERNPLICPFTKPPRKRPIEPSTAKPTDMHINGDILQRVVDRGGEKLLYGMLSAEPDLESHPDFETVEARWARFKELSKEVVNANFRDKVEEAGDVWNEEWARQWLRMTMSWVRYQLRSAL